MKSFRVWLVVAVAVVGAAVMPARAAMFGGGQRDWGQELMAKLFGGKVANINAFTADADMSVTGGKQEHGPMQFTMQYAYLKGNFRTEMDMSSMVGAKMKGDQAAQMKQMGMDKVVTIIQPGKDVMYMVYPSMRSYCEMHPSAFRKDAEKKDKEPKIDVTELGKDTIDGHSCVKKKITITDDNGVSHEIEAWQASDLKDFPIKTEMQHGDSTITTHFHNVKFDAPDSSLFEPPSDFTRYGSMQEMMMGNMQKMMGGMMPPGGAPHGRPSDE